MTGCDEPHCEAYADFTISRNGSAYHFCTKHVWFRAQRWLNRLPNGEQVIITSLSGKAETPPAQRGTVRDMRSDNATGQLVVPAAHDLESTGGSPKGTDQTVAPGEVPAMRKPARKRGTKVPVRTVSK
jgi:hypothetical protein